MSGYKRGPVIRVSINEDGVPFCPHCGQLMYAEETDSGTAWGCPDAQAVNAYISRELAAAFDRFVIKDES